MGKKKEKLKDHIVLWFLFWGSGTFGFFIQGDFIMLGIWQIISLIMKYVFIFISKYLWSKVKEEE